MKQVFPVLVVAWFSLTITVAQTYRGKFVEANYDESKVPDYTLPHVLTSFGGKKINSVEEWEATRRPEILKFFEQKIYGEIPQPSSPIRKSFKLRSVVRTLLDGKCTRKDVEITFENRGGSVTMPLVLFVPNHVKDRVPVMLLANGSDIRRKNLALDDSQRYGSTRNGIPLHQLMMRGIGVATVDYQAFGKDNKDPEGTVTGGIIDLYMKPGQTSRKANEWGMVSVWAYALRAGLDYLETDPHVQEDQVATVGCSIGGKVALWAAATDDRFGMALLATAGHGGDAIWRREFGETLHNMCKYLPTWICQNANQYAENVHEMPVDQHSLLATIAPRPLYVATAHHDLWADQKGQWIGAYNAAPAFELYGETVKFSSSQQPKINQPITESAIGYHVRSGVHGFERFDWEQYMKFIEFHFMKIRPRSVSDVYHSQ